MKDIPGYEGKYAVTRDGGVWSYPRKGSSKRGKFLAITVDKKGYPKVSLWNGKRVTGKVHRLVATVFLKNPRRLPQVNHIDGKKVNNIVENLEWCTNRENMDHALMNGLTRDSKGSKNPQSKLTELKVKRIRSLVQLQGMSLESVAKRFNICLDSVRKIINRRTWKHI